MSKPHTHTESYLYVQEYDVYTNTHPYKFWSFQMFHFAKLAFLIIFNNILITFDAVEKTKCTHRSKSKMLNLNIFQIYRLNKTKLILKYQKLNQHHCFLF